MKKAKQYIRDTEPNLAQYLEGNMMLDQVSEDEIKMWKKAFKEYLEYKNIKTANPDRSLLTGFANIKTGLTIKQNALIVLSCVNMSYCPF